MKERPILFSTPMVQAIIRGDKTQTRREVKGISHPLWNLDLFRYDGINEQGSHIMVNDIMGVYAGIECPYGKVGEILWVRETWQHTKCLNLNPEDENYGYVYKADNQPWDDYENWKWKPSIYMPKEACRLRLKITDVRIERLQDISKKDAIAEGVEIIGDYDGLKLYKDYLGDDGFISPSSSFHTLWQSINGSESWYSNPLVWVITFKALNN